jgi:hypothetical protein
LAFAPPLLHLLTTGYGTQEPSWSALGLSAYWGTADYDARVPGSLEPQLLTHEGKPDEARNLMAPIYGWFTEGFDTRDLKEAKALLDTLAS